MSKDGRRKGKKARTKGRQDRTRTGGRQERRERGNEGKKDKERERLRDVVGREEVKKERISG